jgi:hypothetical protein
MRHLLLLRTDLVACHHHHSAGKLLGLGGKVTGYAHIKPALDLGGQIKNLDGHGEVPRTVPGFPPLRFAGAGASKVAPCSNIGLLADRFQYLLFNNP